MSSFFSATIDEDGLLNAFMDGTFGTFDDRIEQSRLLDHGAPTDVLNETGTPAVRLWRDVPTEAMANITFDSARGELLESLQNEVSAIQDLFEAKFSTKRPSIKQICTLFLGEESKIYDDVFKHVEGLDDYETFSKFVGTFFLSNAMGLSCTELLDNTPYWVDENIKGLCLDASLYKKIWRAIEKDGLPSEGTDNYTSRRYRGTNPLWKKLQTTTNSLLKEYLISNYDQRKLMRLTIDDDKQHVSAKCGQAMLKLVRHTRDNVDGLVLNTAAWTASGVVVGLRYESLYDSGTTSCTIDLIKEIIGLCLTNIVFLMDRGYWAWCLVFFIISKGGRLLGTMKRLLWFAWTYDQQFRTGDKRTIISTSGIRKCVQKVLQVTGTQVRLWASSDYLAREHVAAQTYNT